MRLYHTTFATALLTIAALGTLNGCAADIRPDDLKTLTQPTPQAQAKGRAMLARAAELHGLASWRSVKTYTMTLNDEWEGIMPRMMSPWPEKDIRARMSFRAGSFDARSEFLSGSKKGTVWGMQSWRTYEILPGQEAAFKPNDNAAFILPALQYLFEFHFRDHTHQVVTYAGPETVRGVTYERVFLTWDTLEPSDQVDQYMVYLDAKTGHIRKIFYTVRDLMSAATGAIHFEDVRDVDGILVPFTQYVTFHVHDDLKDYAHVVKLESISWNTPSLKTFLVDPQLPTMNDTKR